MRSFAVSILLLLVMLGGIGYNYIYINRVADEMCAQIDALPEIDAEDCPAQAAELAEYWEKHADTVGLSVGYTVVDRVSEQAATLSACAACGDVFGYHTALALLRDAVGDMRRLESFGIGNLL